MNEQSQPKRHLSSLWQAGVDSVRGVYVTRKIFAVEGVSEVKHLLAIGKAADSMCQGALSRMAKSGRALVITKYGHASEVIKGRDNVKIIESGHPVPDQNSLHAGNYALSFVKSIPKTDSLVMLVSGGSSALAESLPGHIDLAMLKELNRKLVSGGYPIDQINAVRGRISRVKGGRLLSNFKGEKAIVYAISDVPGDDVAIIGSGIGSRITSKWPAINLPHEIQEVLDIAMEEPQANNHLSEASYCERVIASNAIARDAVAKLAQKQGYQVILNSGDINKDVNDVAKQIGDQLLKGENGIYIWGGEPTIVLPDAPGTGGRNQHLALAIAKCIRGSRNITIIAAGTDGTDGPTNAAGAIVDGNTFACVPGSETALTNANSGAFLESANALYHCGPTGTNVMDIVIAMKSEAKSA